MKWEEYLKAAGIPDAMWTGTCLSGFRLVFDRKSTNSLTSINLSEDKPNLVCVGSTGSGKTEFMRFVIANIIRRFSPRVMNLELVSGREGEFELPSGGFPYWLMPHLHSTTYLEDNPGLLTTLKKLAYDIEQRDYYLSSKAWSDITEYNTAMPVNDRIPYKVIILNEIMQFIYDSEEDNTCANLLSFILEHAGRVGYRIIMVEQGFKDNKVTKELLSLIDNKLALKCHPESSRVVLGADIASTIKSGTGEAYVKEEDTYSLVGISMIDESLLMEYINSMSGIR